MLIMTKKTTPLRYSTLKNLFCTLAVSEITTLYLPCLER